MFEQLPKELRESGLAGHNEVGGFPTGESLQQFVTGCGIGLADSTDSSTVLSGGGFPKIFFTALDQEIGDGKIFVTTSKKSSGIRTGKEGTDVI